nr:hypothetical protein CFP56_52457 [Quercus suber]
MQQEVLAQRRRGAVVERIGDRDFCRAPGSRCVALLQPSKHALFSSTVQDSDPNGCYMRVPQPGTRSTDATVGVVVKTDRLTLLPLARPARREYRTVDKRCSGGTRVDTHGPVQRSMQDSDRGLIDDAAPEAPIATWPSHSAIGFVGQQSMVASLAIRSSAKAIWVRGIGLPLPPVPPSFCGEQHRSRGRPAFALHHARRLI